MINYNLETSRYFIHGSGLFFFTNRAEIRFWLPLGENLAGFLHMANLHLAYHMQGISIWALASSCAQAVAHLSVIFMHDTCVQNLQTCSSMQSILCYTRRTTHVGNRSHLYSPTQSPFSPEVSCGPDVSIFPRNSSVSKSRSLGGPLCGDMFLWSGIKLATYRS